MLVIDENKLKLLKMKESLLKAHPDNHDAILSEYKSIVLNIDKELYDDLIAKIKNTNYYNQPLDKQLSLLTKLVDMYNDFNEFQCKYSTIYEQYAQEKLELSNINDIYIDKINQKISAINGYLINNQNIHNNETMLENLNMELIEAEKRKDIILQKFRSLELSLKNNLFTAEGRKYNENGNIEYTSIKDEYLANDIDLEKILDDSSLLDKELENTTNVLSSEEEKMKAAQICFKNMPTMDTKKLYNMSITDVLKAKNKLVLLKIAKLITSEYTKYDDLKAKRTQINDLINERLKYLKELDIRLFVDPFDHIKLKEQLEIINSIGDIEIEISSIKTKIKEYTSRNETASLKTTELLHIINNEEPLFKDKIVKLEMVEEKSLPKYANNSQIINIKDAPNKFHMDIVKSKTSGVINRVYELVTAVPVATEASEIVPELVVEKNETPEIEIETGQTETDKKSLVDETLFQEVKPFEEAVLFDERYDDGVFTDEETKSSSTNEEIDVMPELSLPDEKAELEPESSNEILSFDEQVEQLLSNNPKVKKLVS